MWSPVVITKLSSCSVSDIHVTKTVIKCIADTFILCVSISPAPVISLVTTTASTILVMQRWRASSPKYWLSTGVLNEAFPQRLYELSPNFSLRKACLILCAWPCLVFFIYSTGFTCAISILCLTRLGFGFTPCGLSLPFCLHLVLPIACVWILTLHRAQHMMTSMSSGNAVYDQKFPVTWPRYQKPQTVSTNLESHIVIIIALMSLFLLT